MNLAALIARTRTLADDAAGAALWADEDLTAYLNEGQQEAAIRARLLQEIGNDEYCLVELIADQRQYDLHPLVWEVNAARRDTDTRDLDRVAIETVRFARSGGHPAAYALYGASNHVDVGLKLLLDRPAVEDADLQLDVYRLPEAMEDGADTPEIDATLHEPLCFWALHKMFQHRDSDAEDLARSARFEGLFIARFGIRVDANVARKQRRHRAPLVKVSYP